MSNQALLAIEIQQLQAGMFVVKLDIPWLDSPFLSHTRLIKDEKDVKALRDAGVHRLVIDTSKGSSPEANAPINEVDPDETSPAPPPQPTVKSVPLAQIPPVQPIEQKKTSLQQEIKAALAVRGKIKKAVDQLQKGIEAEKPINVEQLTPLIDHTLASLERNDQALMNLVHLSRKSQKLADHTFGTFCLVLNLALTQGVTEEEREQLGLAALMHDLGWTQLPLNLMGKRQSYTATEKSLVRKHLELGTKALANSQLPPLTRRIIEEHHELLDGSGYPLGLTKGDLSPLSGILSIVDEYEEKVHQLLDKPGMVPTKALRSLYHDAEKGLFCPELVAAFISMLGIYPVGTAVLLNTKEKALVVEFHKQNPLQPSVRIVYDVNGHALSKPVLVDLRNQEGEVQIRSIDSAIDANEKQQDPQRRLYLSEDDFL